MQNNKERLKDTSDVQELDTLLRLNYNSHGVFGKNQKRRDSCKAIGTIYRKSNGHYDDNLIGVLCRCGEKHPVEKKEVLWEENLLEPTEKTSLFVSIKEDFFYNSRLSSWGLSVRANNCLIQNDIDSVKKLLSCSREDLLKWKNAGKGTVDEIEKFLMSRGYSLRTSKE